MCLQVRQVGAGEGCFFEDFLFIGKGVLELCVNDSGPLQEKEAYTRNNCTGFSKCWYKVVQKQGAQIEGTLVLKFFGSKQCGNHSFRSHMPCSG